MQEVNCIDHRALLEREVGDQVALVVRLVAKHADNRNPLAIARRARLPLVADTDSVAHRAVSPLYSCANPGEQLRPRVKNLCRQLSFHRFRQSVNRKIQPRVNVQLPKDDTEDGFEFGFSHHDEAAKPLHLSRILIALRRLRLPIVQRRVQIGFYCFPRHDSGAERRLLTFPSEVLFLILARAHRPCD